MKKIYILAFIMAIVVGLTVYYFADSMQKAALEQAAIPEGNVVIANRFIPANTEITADMLMLADWPMEAINQLSARKLDEVVGAITQLPVEMNEQILTTRIEKRGEEGRGRLSYVLEPGFRAITLPVNEISGVAGNISRGDYVDLVVTMLNAEYEEKNPVSFYIVENVQVLAVGKKVVANTENNAASEYASVTLAVTPDQAIKINYADRSGIRLVLRPVLDDQITGETWYPTIFPDTVNSAAPQETEAAE